MFKPCRRCVCNIRIIAIQSRSCKREGIGILNATAIRVCIIRYIYVKVYLRKISSWSPHLENNLCKYEIAVSHLFFLSGIKLAVANSFRTGGGDTELINALNPSIIRRREFSFARQLIKLDESQMP